MINFGFEKYLQRENRIKQFLNPLWQKLKISSLDWFFFTLIFNLIHDEEKNFLNCLSTWASGRENVSFLKSNDPTVVTRDYDTF